MNKHAFTIRNMEGLVMWSKAVQCKLNSYGWICTRFNGWDIDISGESMRNGTSRAEWINHENNAMKVLKKWDCEIN